MPDLEFLRGRKPKCGIEKGRASRGEPRGEAAYPRNRNAPTIIRVAGERFSV